MSDKQKGVLWFNVQSANIIPIVEFSNTGNKSSYTYPSVWRIGDPIEELDLMLTYMTSPRLIPGMTTKSGDMYLMMIMVLKANKWICCWSLIHPVVWGLR